jgi:TPR repeat protein
MRFLFASISVLTLAGCNAGGNAGSALVDNFTLRTGIVAETPRSVVVRYNSMSSSLAEATAIAQAHCQTGRYDAALQTTSQASDFVIDAQFLCISSPTATAPTPSGSADIYLLHKSADLGDPEAMFKLGVLYSDKHGELPPDYPQSMLWLHRAADKGNSNAMALIGAAYIKGGIGVTADPTEAMRWLTKAANLGNAPSMAVLGTMYYQGIGVKMDKTEAAQWFRKAADLGVVQAMKILGQMYEEGVGVPVDKAEAQRWYQKATQKQ